MWGVLCSVMSDVLAACVPAAERLVQLLAPWDRARLRLTCRALAAAVPARSCAPTLAAMVRAPGGGAALLRYCAGDARPCWVHALVAAEADAADALRWLLPRLDAVGSPVLAEPWRQLARCALRWGSVAAWRVLEPRLADAGAADGFALLEDAMCGGVESVAAERAALEAGRCGGDVTGVIKVLDTAIKTHAVGAIAPFLRPDISPPVRHVAGLAALCVGHRSLVEPCDWLPTYGPGMLLRAALHGGERELADAAVAEAGGISAGDGRQLLSFAVSGRRDAPATIEWVVRAIGLEACRFDASDVRALASWAIRADSADALRWLVERAGLVPADPELSDACMQDAIACFRYLVDVAGVCVARDMLVDALYAVAPRTATAAAAILGGLDVDAFVSLATGCPDKRDGRLRTASALRRRALLPAPGPAFLRACVHLPEPLDVLVVAGYRVDADARTWLDSVRPHCAGTSRRVWRPLAHALRDRWRQRSLGCDAPGDT